jgi:hypothetical protein
MDALLVGNFLLRKEAQDPATIERVRASRNFEAD